MKYLVYLIICFICGCSTTKDSPKYTFSNSTYRVKSKEDKYKAYVAIDKEKIIIYKYFNGKYDTTAYTRLFRKGFIDSTQKYMFTKYSFDVDLISIPLKYRLQTEFLPHQLNSSINGGLYIGRRADMYFMRKKELTFTEDHFAIYHLGVSFGIFAGIGSTQSTHQSPITV